MSPLGRIVSSAATYSSPHATRTPARPLRCGGRRLGRHHAVRRLRDNLPPPVLGGLPFGVRHRRAGSVAPGGTGVRVRARDADGRPPKLAADALRPRSETLRLHPPAPNVVREAVEADVVAGRGRAAGGPVWISPRVIHRHRKLWADSTAFRPERFEGRPAPWTSGAFVPFGGGPRTCIGASFALAEAQIVLARLLDRFSFDAQGQTPVMPLALLTLGASREPMFRLHASAREAVSRAWRAPPAARPDIMGRLGG